MPSTVFRRINNMFIYTSNCFVEEFLNLKGDTKPSVWAASVCTLVSLSFKTHYRAPACVNCCRCTAYKWVKTWLNWEFVDTNCGQYIVVVLGDDSASIDDRTLLWFVKLFHWLLHCCVVVLADDNAIDDRTVLWFVKLFHWLLHCYIDVRADDSAIDDRTLLCFVKLFHWLLHCCSWLWLCFGLLTCYIDCYIVTLLFVLMTALLMIELCLHWLQEHLNRRHLCPNLND